VRGPFFGAYRGSVSSGFEIRKPLSPAAFSPCLPKPYPALKVGYSADGVGVAALAFSGCAETNDDAPERRSAAVLGRSSEPESRHSVMERREREDGR